MLNRAKFMYIIFIRYNYNSAGVLTATYVLHPTQPFASRFISALRIVIPFSSQYFFNISECGFFSNSTDCSGSENLTLAEKCFGVFMDYRLILARKVKVNIRLFIALKSKECFKRNIMSVFFVLQFRISDTSYRASHTRTIPISVLINSTFLQFGQI